MNQGEYAPPTHSHMIWCRSWIHIESFNGLWSWRDSAPTDITGFNYMFGGNPGRSKSDQMRLDDLWKLSVSHSWYYDNNIWTNTAGPINTETLFKECHYKLRQTRSVRWLVITDLPLSLPLTLGIMSWPLVSHLVHCSIFRRPLVRSLTILAHSRASSTVA